MRLGQRSGGSIKRISSLSTATLMRTGQTTVFRTGDDSDTSGEGRATDFSTLAENNPFGTTERFTSELGTQTYTNDIVIDWSTYNGSTVLGWYRVVDTAIQDWDVSIDSGLALSISTFTSGWRLPNLGEIFSIQNFELSDRVDYSPMNVSSILQFASTTRANSTTSAWAIGTQTTGSITSLGKTSTRSRTIYCRTFIVTGTTLT